MKVVLFCGGLGMRLREYSEQIPKPMVPVGDRPIIWHLMKYYAHFGHRDFILCLGYKADYIKEYFFTKRRAGDLRFSESRTTHDAAERDLYEWRITFADTGANTNIGGRLLAVRRHLEGEEEFLANYTDILSDLPLGDLISGFRESGGVGGFVAVRPHLTSHIVTTDERGMVESVGSVASAQLWSNGGYLILKQEIFDHMRAGEELVEQPFGRLIEQKRLYAHKYRGFWTSMDTFKEKQQLDDLCAQGHTPWEVWKRSS